MIGLISKCEPHLARGNKRNTQWSPHFICPHILTCMYWVLLHIRSCAVDSDRPESFPEEITVCWRDMDNGLNDCTIIVMISVRKGNKRALEKQLTEGPKSVGSTKDQGQLSSERHLKWDWRMSGDLVGMQMRIGVEKKMDGSPQRRSDLSAIEEPWEEHVGRSGCARQTWEQPSTATAGCSRRHELPGAQWRPVRWPSGAHLKCSTLGQVSSRETVRETSAWNSCAPTRAPEMTNRGGATWS